MHKICIWRQRESATSHTSSCCWFNPPFGNKIDLQEQFQSETSTFWNHLRGKKQWNNENVGDGKCERRWLWGGVAPSYWLATSQLLPVGHLHLLPTFWSTTFHKKTIEDHYKMEQTIVVRQKWLHWIMPCWTSIFPSGPGLIYPGVWQLALRSKETESFWFPDYNISLVCFDN